MLRVSHTRSGRPEGAWSSKLSSKLCMVDANHSLPVQRCLPVQVSRSGMSRAMSSAGGATEQQPLS